LVSPPVDLTVTTNGRMNPLLHFPESLLISLRIEISLPDTLRIEDQICQQADREKERERMNPFEDPSLTNFYTNCVVFVCCAMSDDATHANEGSISADTGIK
jgi:hypothetical protein